MMKNHDESVEINRNPNWTYIFDCPQRILIIADSASGTTNVFMKLIKHQPTDVDKIYLYVEEPFELKYQLLINCRENVRIK